MKTDIKLNIGILSEPESKTEQLICDHCKLPHPCTKEYSIKYSNKPWWCGLCYLAFLNNMNGSPITMKTDCFDHPVPEFIK